MASPAALAVCGLRRAFRRNVVLDGVDLTVEAGTVTAVLGPSGGGKTTLLRIIAGFDHPDGGTISIDGVSVSGPDVHVPPERRHVGVVPQEGALFPHLDVAHNVGFGLPRSTASASRIDEVLELVGLAGLHRKRPHQLSGGQQHRVALARALAPHPALVMLDEPFSSLDAGLRAQVRDEVLFALRATQATAVVVTHDQQEALSMADHVAVLLDGRIAQHADPATLYESPVSLAVATFIGDAVVLCGQADGQSVHCALGTLPIHSAAWPAGTVDVVIRPEQVELRDTFADDTDDLERGATGVVTSRAFFGHDGSVRVALAGGESITARVHAGRLPEPGSHVSVRVSSPVSVFARTVR